MTTLSNRNPTLLDLSKITDPSGNISEVVEILNETNEVLTDMSWQEGNLVTGHQHTVRTGIPSATWRKMYGGVQPNKSNTAQVTDNTGMLEQFAEVDAKLADLNGNSAAWRLQEDRPHIEGMNQEIVDTLFYGNEKTEPEAFTGFAARFNDLSAPNADNILDAGGTDTNNASIWLIVWGPQTCFGIVPKGSTAGLRVEDLGKILIQDASDGSNTGRMMAYSTHYMWDAGLAVVDWRFIVRIANINKSLLTRDAATGADLADLMFQAQELIPNEGMGRAAFYMSRINRTFLRRQLSAATNMATLTTENVGGTRVTSFQGTPIRRVDALASDEARVT